MENKISFSKLTKIQKSNIEFYKTVYEYNFSNYDLNSLVFYDHMIGLIQFGKMLKILNDSYITKLEIYSEEKDVDGIGIRKIFYAIDRYGLIHGYIFGPRKNTDGDILYEIDQNLYYGEGEVFRYQMVDNWKNIRNKIDLTTFLNNYVPLKLKVEDFKSGVNDGDNWYYHSCSGQVIYKHTNMCFEIPFQEFFEEKLELKLARNFKVSIFNNFINYSVIEEGHRAFGKEDVIVTEHKGKIDVKNFAIIEKTKTIL